MQWVITLPSGLLITSLQPEALESRGIMVVPTSIASQESVLTVDGAEDVNGTTILCQAIATTGNTVCPSEDIQLTLIFMVLPEHAHYTSYVIHTLTQVLPHHKLT